MGRKRALKKQQKRLGSVVERLEELDRRGADEEYLALAAAEPATTASGPFAARRAEVADRALSRALAAPDLAGLERLLRLLGPAERRRPAAALASAVVDLAAGRLEAARAKLDSPAAAGGIPDVAGPELLPALLLLAGGDGPAPRSAPPALAELAGLRALAGRPPAGGETPRSPVIGDPLLRAARDLLLALRALEAAGCEPSAAPLRTVHHALGKLTAALPAQDATLGRIAAAAEELLDLLDQLAAAGKRLAGPRHGQAASDLLDDLLQRVGGALAAALRDPAPPPLAPLAHALRLRWRALLGTVAERDGTEELAALAAAHPEPVTAELELPTGDGDARAGLQQARRARTLFAGDRFEELAGLLRARARAEREPSDLAALWALELWTFSHWSLLDSRQEVDDPDDPDLEPDLGPDPAHRAMVRVEELAVEIARRFPSEQRPEVARELRDELFLVCEAITLDEHTGGAAAALLDHLPGDPGLLVAGITGAVAGGDRRCLRDLEQRLARRGTLRPGEREAALRMVTQAAQEFPAHLAEVLRVLRPLFSDADWSAAKELAARRAAPVIGRLLSEILNLAWLDARAGQQGGDLLRSDLAALRPVLAGTAGLAAIDAVVDCWEADAAAADKRARALLAASRGYNTVLIAVETLQATLSAHPPPEGLVAALGRLAGGVIGRLDREWTRWWRMVPILALCASRSQLGKLQRKLEELFVQPGLDEHSRNALASALDTIQMVRRERQPDRAAREPSHRRRGDRAARPRSSSAPGGIDGAGGAGSTVPPPARPRRKPRAADPGDLQLDLDLGTRHPK